MENVKYKHGRLASKYLFAANYRSEQWTKINARSPPISNVKIYSRGAAIRDLRLRRHWHVDYLPMFSFVFASVCLKFSTVSFHRHDNQMAQVFSDDAEMVELAASEEYSDAEHQNELWNRIFEFFESGECCEVTLEAGVDKKR